MSRIAEGFSLDCCDNIHVATVPKAPLISYSFIYYFGNACLKLNFFLIPHSTGKCATQNIESTQFFGHIMEISRSRNKIDDFGLIVSL